MKWCQHSSNSRADGVRGLRRRLHSAADRNSITVFLFFGLLAGLVLQQKPLVGHYSLLIYLPLWLLAAQFWSMRQTWRPARLVVVGLLIPGISFFHQSEQSIALSTEVTAAGSIFISEGPVERASKQIKMIATRESCLHVAHGWRAGSYYHYANLPPCSTHFLANLTILSSSSKEELVPLLSHYKLL
jgi:hypothetical protein